MPTAGRPKVSTRLDEETVQAIRDQLAMTRAHATYRTVLDDEIATFVERAIIEKLDKMKRSRAGKKRTAATVSVVAAASEGMDCQCTEGQSVPPVQ